MPLPYDLAFPDALGRLDSNLAQLEFAIRVALHLQEPEARRMSTEALRALKVGDVLPENFLTDWRTLKMLIGEYNKLEAVRGGLRVDPAIVDLRDALAHGRLSASTLTSEHRLIRFSRPNGNGEVRVEAVYAVTLEWLGEQTDKVARAMQVVFARITELKPDARLRNK